LSNNDNVADADNNECREDKADLFIIKICVHLNTSNYV
jgi:hypothetical protein